MISRRSLLSLLGLGPAVAASQPYHPSAFGWLPPAAMAGELLPFQFDSIKSPKFQLPLWSWLPVAERAVVGPWRRRYLIRERRRRPSRYAPSAVR
jgi:hypothetical protein